MMNVNIENQSPKKEHSLNLVNREKATLTGVSKVLSYGDNELCLETSYGKMEILGNTLKIERFDETQGTLSFSGKINAIKYAFERQPLIRRIFK
jgi:sporulation protein YabP